MFDPRADLSDLDVTKCLPARCTKPGRRLATLSFFFIKTQSVNCIKRFRVFEISDAVVHSLWPF